jgi:excisionase family DNA binding protein
MNSPVDSIQPLALMRLLDADEDRVLDLLPEAAEFASDEEVFDFYNTRRVKEGPRQTVGAVWYSSHRTLPGPTATPQPPMAEFEDLARVFMQIMTTVVQSAVRQEVEPLRRSLDKVIGDTSMSPVDTRSSGPVLDPTVLWDVRQVAKFLGVSVSSVYHRAAAGKIPCVRPGSGNTLRFDPGQLRAWASGALGSGRVSALKK